MILLWFLLGFALITALARYNESDKLFWTLLLAYLLGVAGGTIYSKIAVDENKSKSSCAQVDSIQMAGDTLELFVDSLGNVSSVPPKENTKVLHDSVGQGLLARNTVITDSSHVKKVPTQPPQQKFKRRCIHTLILHEQK